MNTPLKNQALAYIASLREEETTTLSDMRIATRTHREHLLGITMMTAVAALMLLLSPLNSGIAIAGLAFTLSVVGIRYLPVRVTGTMPAKNTPDFTLDRRFRPAKIMQFVAIVGFVASLLLLAVTRLTETEISNSFTAVLIAPAISYLTLLCSLKSDTWYHEI